jgi:opacity protein-like surface antigen
MASWDTLRFRNNFNLDLTGRIGAYFSSRTAVYALGGLAISSVNFRYDCAGFCAVQPATPAFSAETTMMIYGGVIGAGLETQLPTSANTAFYIEYRAYLLQPVTLDVGSIATRSTSQQIDLSHQTVIAGARLRF